MRLKTYTDYSLRLLIYVTLMGDALATIKDVSEAYEISKNHLMKVAYQLGQRGFLETVRGRKGGLRLARPPNRIIIGAVVRVMEDDMALVECFSPGSNACVITGPCSLRGILSEALDAYLKVLDRYTLADLVASRSKLSRILMPK